MTKMRQKAHIFFVIAAALCMILAFNAQTVHAASGFTTINGKTYYYDSDGSVHKGWLKLDGKYYYFNKSTGVQVKGWVYSNGLKSRYFTTGTGVMATGFLEDSKNITRYFDPVNGILHRGFTKIDGKTYYFTSSEGAMLTGWTTSSTGNTRYFNSEGIMQTGLKKITVDGKAYYFYFNKSSGVMYKKGFGTIGSNRYYFDKETGRAKTGWLTINGTKYYFNTANARMYRSTTAVIGGVTYSFSSSGAASEAKNNYGSYTQSGGYVLVYDNVRGKNFYLNTHYAQDTGIADGSVSDLTLLAALCDAEAGDQGLIGMEAVCMCILNRTITDEFPSEVRWVIYQTKPLQYAVVTNGTLQQRIQDTHWENKTLAMQAAQKAMNMIEAYKTAKTPRTISGFGKTDFTYLYFMMTYSYQSYINSGSLTSKCNPYTYKDHTFFDDWV